MSRNEIQGAGPPRIFDPARRAAARDRAQNSFGEYDFLYHHMLEGLLERLGDVQRPLCDVLLIGCPDASARDALSEMGKSVISCDPSVRNAAAMGGVRCEEDALPFPEARFDLVFAVGTLDSVNDLPGALINIRRVLRPDGLFLGACLGAGTLSRLKQVLLDAEGDSASPHVHPQVDVRAAGDLLARTGFAMPVADVEPLTVRYRSLLTLMHDLRGMGHGNVMTRERRGSLRRNTIAKASVLFEQGADTDGKTPEAFSILYLSGWKPDPSQAAPARRGSGEISLAEALKPKN